MTYKTASPHLEGGECPVRFFHEKTEVSKAFQKENWMLYLFMIQPFPDMIPLSAFLRLLLSPWSPGKRFFVVWHSFSFTLEENSPWKFPYVHLLLYIFMSTVPFLTTFKTYALSQVISPKSNSAVTWFMDYGDCIKLWKQVWHFYLVKVTVPEHIKWQDLPTGLDMHVVLLLSVINLSLLKQAVGFSKRLSLHIFVI